MEYFEIFRYLHKWYSGIFDIYIYKALITNESNNESNENIRLHFPIEQIQRNDLLKMLYIEQLDFKMEKFNYPF